MLTKINAKTKTVVKRVNRAIALQPVSYGVAA